MAEINHSALEPLPESVMTDRPTDCRHVWQVAVGYMVIIAAAVMIAVSAAGDWRTRTSTTDLRNEIMELKSKLSVAPSHVKAELEAFRAEVRVRLRELEDKIK